MSALRLSQSPGGAGAAAASQGGAGEPQGSSGANMLQRMQASLQAAPPSHPRPASTASGEAAQALPQLARADSPWSVASDVAAALSGADLSQRQPQPSPPPLPPLPPPPVPPLPQEHQEQEGGSHPMASHPSGQQADGQAGAPAAAACKNVQEAFAAYMRCVLHIMPLMASADTGNQEALSTVLAACSEMDEQLAGWLWANPAALMEMGGQHLLQVGGAAHEFACWQCLRGLGHGPCAARCCALWLLRMLVQHG